MNLVKSKPSPAGELFSQSAAATKRLEHIAFTIGAMVDIVRELTVRPLTASQRVSVVAALKSLDGPDPWTRAVDHTLARLKIFADNLDRS